MFGRKEDKYSSSQVGNLRWKKISRNDVLFSNVETNIRGSTFKNREKKSRVELEVVFFTISFAGLFIKTMYNTTLLKVKMKKNRT